MKPSLFGGSVSGAPGRPNATLRGLGAALLVLALVPACTVNIGTPDGPAPAQTGGAASSGASGGSGGDETIGSGNVISQTRSVSGFNRVRLGGLGNLFVEQTGVESLTIEAEDNILPLLSSDVAEGRLTLGLRPGTRIVTSRPIIYRLTVKDLTGIDASGSGTTQVNGLDTDRFDFAGTGSAQARVAGRAAQQSILLSGSGEYDGGSLISREVTVEISGSAGAVVNASEILQARISGSGNVVYLGSPRVSQMVSGSGTVRAR